MIDIVAAVVVAVAVLLPAPSRKVHPFYEGKAAQMARQIAAAQSDLLRDPTDRGALERLVDALVQAGQSDWALRVAGEEAGKAVPDQWRPTMLVSIVHADRLEPKPALEWCEKALGLCDAPGTTCEAYEKVRLDLYCRALDAGVKSGIDPAKDPKGFDDAIQKHSPPIIHTH